MGIKAKNGVVLAVEKKQKSFLYDESSISKVIACGSTFPPITCRDWICNQCTCFTLGKTPPPLPVLIPDLPFYFAD